MPNTIKTELLGNTDLLDFHSREPSSTSRIASRHGDPVVLCADILDDDRDGECDGGMWRCGGGIVCDECGYTVPSDGGEAS